MTAPVAMGIDPAPRNCGWGVHSRGWRAPVFGTLKLPSWETNDEGFIIECAINEFGRKIDEFGVTCVYVERPVLVKDVGKGGKTRFNLASILGQIHVDGAIALLCHQRGLPRYHVNIGDWRERFIGKRRAPPGIIREGPTTTWWKDQAIAACAQRNWYPDDHNAAEALGITDFGLATTDRTYRVRTDPHTRRAEIAPAAE